MNTNPISARFRAAAALLMGGCLLTLTACGGTLGSDSSPAGDGGANSAPQSSAAGAAAPSGGGLLEEADFDLYLDGAVAIDTPKVAYYDTLTDADNTPYVTSRGISVGNSIDELVQAYKGIVCSNFVVQDENGSPADTEMPGNIDTANISDFMDANPNATRFMVLYTLIRGDGEEWEMYSLYINVLDSKVSSVGVGYDSGANIQDAAENPESHDYGDLFDLDQ